MELRKLVLSPKKVKSNCFIHCDGFKNDEKLSNCTDISWETVRKASVIRNDAVVTETINSMSYENFSYYKNCYCSYTHPKTLKSIARKLLEESSLPESSSANTDVCTPLPRTSSRRRDGTSSILANTECCICSKRKTKKGGSGYEKLEKYLTEVAAKILQKFALVKESPAQLMMDVIGLEWEKIVAKELYYHRTCYRDYTRPEKTKDDSTMLVELDAFF